MTPTVRNALRGGLAAAGMLAGVVLVAGVVVALALPLITAVAWVSGVISFEAAVIVILLCIWAGVGL